MPSPLGRCQVSRNALGSALSMRPAITLLTTFAFISAGCAPRSAPLRDASSVRLESADVPAPPPNPPSSPPPQTTLEDAAPPPRPVRDEARGSQAMPRAMGWFSLSFGVAAALVATGTSIMILNQTSIRNADCNAEKLCSAAGLTANQQLQGLDGWNAASYLAAAVGIGVGAVLILTSPAKSKDETAIGVSPTSSGAAFTLRSTF
jgi:hypothetical protein